MTEIKHSLENDLQEQQLYISVGKIMRLIMPYIFKALGKPILRSEKAPAMGNVFM